MSNIWIYVVSHVQVASWLLASQPAILHGEKFSFGQHMQAVQQNSFISAMLVDTIDFYHLIPLSVGLTLAMWVTRSAKKKTFRLHFLANISTEWGKIWCGGEAIC